MHKKGRERKHTIHLGQRTQSCKYIFRGSREEVVSALSPVLRGLSHESLDVRLHALSRLRYILRHNQEAVHHLTTDADTVHPTISELFSILLGNEIIYYE